MAITLFGSASSPADNASQAGPGPVSITPPASMLAGDLVTVMVMTRTADVQETMQNVTTGGQSWHPLLWDTTTTLSWARWACRFNGSWAANPTFEDGQGQTTPLTAKMDVWRPTSTSKIMDIDW